MKRYIKKFLKLGQKWQDRLWLGDWKIAYSEHNTLPPPAGERSSNAAYSTAVDTVTNPKYKSATLRLAHGPLKNMDEKEMNRIACHEMIHVLTSSMDNLFEETLLQLPKAKASVFEEWYRQTDERMTTDLENVLLWAEKSSEKWK